VDVEDGVARPVAGDGVDRLGLRHDLAGFGPAAGDDPGRVDLQFREGEPLARRLLVGRGLLQERLGGALRRLGLIMLASRRVAGRQQPLLAFEVGRRLAQLGMGGGDPGLRGGELGLLFLGIETRQQIASLDVLAGD
jgi:hypothetical protein